MTTGPKIERRRLIRLGAIAAGLTVASAACEVPLIAPKPSPILRLPAFPEPVPTPPGQVPSGALRFFNPMEAATVSALMDTIFPGTEQDQGAVQAGCLNYLDNLLANGDGWAQPIYKMGPFAKTYEGDTPPPDEPGIVWVKKSELGRYGYQSRLDPRQVYKMGLPMLDAHSRARFGGEFTKLTEDQRHDVVKDLSEGDAKEFDEPAAKQFFTMIRDHTLEGLFADPAYGGNRDLIGWKMIGYPGPQRAYTEADMKDPNFKRAPESLAQMPRFHAGRPQPSGPITPVSGTDIGVTGRDR